MTEEHKQFLELVERMREAQKQYFRDRDRGVLARSKDLERQVDQQIKSAKAPGLFS